MTVRLGGARRQKAGTDGMTVFGTAQYLVEHWKDLRAQLLVGTYRPKQVKRQECRRAGT